jgi:hypothetical protein
MYSRTGAGAIAIKKLQLLKNIATPPTLVCNITGDSEKP